MADIEGDFGFFLRGIGVFPGGFFIVAHSVYAVGKFIAGVGCGVVGGGALGDAPGFAAGGPVYIFVGSGGGVVVDDGAIVFQFPASVRLCIAVLTFLERASQRHIFPQE